MHIAVVPILFALVVCGVILYVVNQVIPIAQPIKVIINALVVLLVVAWLLSTFGLLDCGQAVRLR
jgi:hypothetical protein